MANQQAYAFSFTIGGFDPKTFSVVSFKGHEAISLCYHFEIVLAASSLQLDYSKILHQHCKLEITGQEQSRTVNGIVFRFRHIRKNGPLYYYQVILTPKLDLLTLTTSSRVFLDKTFSEIMEKILKETGIPFENKILQKDTLFPTCEYICQFNETNYQFFCRWLESQGVHFFFNQQKDEEKLILTNSSMAHEQCHKHTPHLIYLPVSGQDHKLREILVRSFMSEYCCLPEKVIFKDYNYNSPKTELKKEHEVSSTGQGTDYHYGACFLEQGYQVDPAQIRAEELLSLESLFQGESFCPCLEAGHTFLLKEHYHEPYNTEYLIAYVQHEGVDKSFLKQDNKGPEKEAQQLYSNSFRALPANSNYRPPKRTPVPHFFGLLSATIDAEGSGEYAELDAKGRYKIRLPFDKEDKQKGKASHWIRMAEPYAGNTAQNDSFGMHFPLLKGTEVLISFVEGDIDRPVITSALYNESNENPVTSKNNSDNILKTKSGNILVMSDKKDKESVGIATRNCNTIFVASNDPDNPGITSATKKKVVQATVNDSFTAKAGSSIAFTAGTDFGAFAGSKMSVTGGITSAVNLGWDVKYGYGLAISFGSQKSVIQNTITNSAEEGITLKAGMNTAVKGYYSSIQKQLFASATAGLATDISSWSAIAGAKGGYSDINSTAAQIAGGVTGSLGAVVQVIGAGYATKNYLALSKEVNKDLFATRLELKATGASLKVIKPGGTDDGLKITVGSAALDQSSSSFSIDGKGETITLTNQSQAKLTMTEGDLFKVTVGMVGTQLSMPGSGNITLGTDNGGSLIIPTTAGGKIWLKKKSGGMLALSSDGATLADSSAGTNCIKLTNTGIRMNFGQGQLSGNSTLKINAGGMIMVG